MTPKTFFVCSFVSFILIGIAAAVVLLLFVPEHKVEERTIPLESALEKEFARQQVNVQFTVRKESLSQIYGENVPAILHAENPELFALVLKLVSATIPGESIEPITIWVWMREASVSVKDQDTPTKTAIEMTYIADAPMPRANVALGYKATYDILPGVFWKIKNFSRTEAVIAYDNQELVRELPIIIGIAAAIVWVVSVVMFAPLTRPNKGNLNGRPGPPNPIPEPKSMDTF